MLHELLHFWLASVLASSTHIYVQGQGGKRSDP